MGMGKNLVVHLFFRLLTNCPENLKWSRHHHRHHHFHCQNKYLRWQKVYLGSQNFVVWHKCGVFPCRRLYLLRKGQGRPENGHPQKVQCPVSLTNSIHWREVSSRLKMHEISIPSFKTQITQFTMMATHSFISFQLIFSAIWRDI